MFNSRMIVSVRRSIRWLWIISGMGVALFSLSGWGNDQDVVLDEKVEQSSSVLPRFASMRASEVNARTGPNVRYPIRWVYKCKGEPVEVIAEFEHWRRIRDYFGDDGWVHERMLSTKRYAIVQASQNVTLYKRDSLESTALALLEPGVRLILHACYHDWCRVEMTDREGWILRHTLWGVYPDEVFE